MHRVSTNILLLLIVSAVLQSALYAQQPSLAESLLEDVSLQDATLIIMRSALGGRDQAAVVSRGGFANDIQIYVATYRNMRDTATLANIQNRYSTARAELLEPRLPATIEALVAVLEML